MNRFARSAVALLLVGIAIAIAAGSAPANRLSLNRQSFRITWTELLFFASSGEVIRCHVTMEGTYHSTIFAKTSGAQWAVVTGAQVRECNGTIVFLTETLPWGIEYSSFSGTLPNITRLTFNLTRFSVRWGSLERCLFATEAGTPLPLKEERNTTTTQLTGVEPDAAVSIPLTGTTCFVTSMSVGASGVITVRESGEGIFVRLI